MSFAPIFGGFGSGGAGGGGPAYPTTLYGAGDTGGFYDFITANIVTGSASGVEEIEDTSGSGNNLVSFGQNSSAGADHPELVTDGTYGTQRASFAGSGSQNQFGPGMRNLALAGGGISAQPITFFWAGRSLSTDIQIFFTGASGSDRAQLSNSSGNDLTMFANSGSLDTTLGGDGMTVDAYLCEFNGSSSKFFRNGTELASGTISAASLTTEFHLARLWDRNRGADWDLWSFGFIDRILTSGEKTDLNTWLRDRIGI